MARHHLRFAPKILTRLGEELVPHPDMGIMELVRNAYDADATECSIELVDSARPGGSIIVSDDGHGMTDAELTSDFLLIGSSRKPSSPFTRKGRRRVGEKGLGRLAALRLGRRVKVTTRSAASPGVQYTLAKPAAAGEQGELFPVWRYPPFFTDNPAPALQAEREHRHHAVIEQVIADSKAGAFAHLPSGHFNANAAWLTLWAMAYNLLRATGALTSAFHTKATTATLRAHLVNVPARIARSARRLTLHLPRRWPWQHAWTHLFDTVHAPPEPA